MNITDERAQKYLDYIYLKQERKLTEIPAACKPPCTVTNTYINLRDKEDSFDDEYNPFSLSLTFNTDVRLTRKILAYGPYEFLIDVGSSLGLWLGLSVLGLNDLALELIVYIRDKYCNKYSTSS